MTIDLSENSAKILAELTATGASPEEVVESALERLFVEIDGGRVDPSTGISKERLKRLVAEGEADLETGKYASLNSAEELHEFMDEVKRRGRARLADRDR